MRFAGLRAGEAVAHECLQLPVPRREDNRRFALDCFCLPSGASAFDGSLFICTGAERPQRRRWHQPDRRVPSPLRPTDSARVADEQPPSGDFLPQCPFTGFPLPPLPRVLRGHYLTDQSDWGLTDAEGGDYVEGGLWRRGLQRCESERRVPQVAASEEYFLFHCLLFIKERSTRLLKRQALQQLGCAPKVSSPSSDLSECEELPCREAEAGEIGDKEVDGVIKPLTVPALSPLSSVALIFMRRLPTAAQRLFYRAFLAGFPLSNFPQSKRGEDFGHGSPTAATQEQQSSAECEGEEDERQQRQQPRKLPFLSDFLDALFTCISDSTCRNDEENLMLSEEAQLLCQTLTRRLKRGVGGKALDMECFLLLLAKHNSVVRDLVLCPIRASAKAFFQDLEQAENPPETAAVEVPPAPCSGASLESFVKELMLPALPAHARSAKPPKMAAVAVGALLVETLEKLDRAFPATWEPLQQRAAAIDALILKSLANSQFVSAVSSSAAARGLTSLQSDEANRLESSQHEQLCWMCRGEGDLLLCDGSPDPVSLAGAASEHDTTRESRKDSGDAPVRLCRHVFHVGCAFPPPTPAELQPNARWSCPLCKAKAFREQRCAPQHRPWNLQQKLQQDQDIERQQQQCREQGWQHHGHELRQVHDIKKHCTPQAQQQPTEEAGASRSGAAVGPCGTASNDMLQYIFDAVNSLAQQDMEKRTARQAQLSLASCKELQLAALKRLFVDKTRGLLARTRQLCKRLDFLQSKRKRLWAAARRRKNRLRPRADPQEVYSPQACGVAEALSAGRSVEVPSQHASQRSHRHTNHSISPSLGENDRDKQTGLACSGHASSAARRRLSPASATPEKAENLRAGAVDAQRTRRTRSATLLEKSEASSAATRATGANVTVANVTASGPGNMEDTVAVSPAVDRVALGRFQEGEKEVSDGTQEDESSENEAEHHLDPFAAAAQVTPFAEALQLFSQIQKADASTLPLSLSALQHLQHAAHGCCCSGKRHHDFGGTLLYIAADEELGDTCNINALVGNSRSKSEFCNCGAEDTANFYECLCLRAARRNAALAVRRLLVFEKKSFSVDSWQRGSFACLAPQVCCTDAEVEGLSHGDPFSLERLVAPSRKRRLQQAHMSLRDPRESSFLRTQQGVLVAAQLRHLQQQQQQKGANQQHNLTELLQRSSGDLINQDVFGFPATAGAGSERVISTHGLQRQLCLMVQQLLSRATGAVRRQQQAEVSSPTLWFFGSFSA